MQAHRPEIDRAGHVDAGPGEAAVVDLRVVPGAGGEDRIAADDAVGDLDAGLAEVAEAGGEGLVDELTMLVRARLVTADDVDELEVLRSRHLRSKYGGGLGNLGLFLKNMKILLADAVLTRQTMVAGFASDLTVLGLIGCEW